MKDINYRKTGLASLAILLATTTSASETAPVVDKSSIAKVTASDSAKLSKSQRPIKTGNPDWAWINPRPTGEAYGKSYFLNTQEGWLSISGGRGLMHTTNGGHTWSRSLFGPYYGFTDVFFTDPKNGWAVGNDSTINDFTNDGVIWATNDGGKSWTEQYRSTSEAFGQKGLGTVQFVNPKIGYAFGASAQVLKTNDGGATWAELKIPEKIVQRGIDFTGAKVISGDVIWVVGYKEKTGEDPDSVVLKTEDGGNNWRIIELESKRIFSHIDAWNGQIAWVMGNSSQILRTTDGGTKWDTYSLPQPTLNGNVVGWSFLNPYTFYLAMANGRVLVSTDGGEQWNIVTTIPQARPTSMVFSDIAHGFIFTDHGMMYSTSDAGTSWTSVGSNSDEALSAVSFPTRTVGWVVGDFGTILKSNNAGLNWTRQKSNSFEKLNSVDFYNTKLGLVAGDHGAILKTTDGGVNWTPVSTSITNSLSKIIFSNKMTVWSISAGDNALYKSIDSGSSWNSIETPWPDLNLTDITFVDGLNGWISANNTKDDNPAYGDTFILRTTDGGLTWLKNQVELSDVPLGHQIAKIAFVNNNHGWLIGSRGETDSPCFVLHTEDGGVTWDAQNNFKDGTPPASNCFNISFSSSENGLLFAGSGNMNYMTRDGGATWYQRVGFHTGEYAATYDAAFLDKKTAVAVGTGASIMRSSNGGGTYGPFKPQ